MSTTDNNIVNPTGGGGGGHVILDSTDTPMTQRPNLQFIGATLSDDETNDATVVDIVVPIGLIVDTLPTTVRYTEGATLNLAGLKVNLMYNDSSVKDVTSEVTCSPANGTVLTSDMDTVTVTYQSLFTTTFSIRVDAFTAKVYGAQWDGLSSPIWTRTDDAASFSNPSPAVNNGNGSSPFDNLSPWKDMTKSTVAGVGVVVKIPKFYYKWTKESTGMIRLKIISKDDYDNNSSWADSNGYKCSPAHMDRGDGKGERDEIYVGRYHCATKTYQSTTGVAQAKGDLPTFRTNIHALETNVWQWDYMTIQTIWLLYLVEYANWDSQATIGMGGYTSSGAENSGFTDGMTYHTGTRASSRDSRGHTQYRNIEDLWGYYATWYDGIYNKGTGSASPNPPVNVYVIKNPANFADDTNGTLAYVIPRTEYNNGDGYIYTFNKSTISGYDWLLLPVTNSSASPSTGTGKYVSDYYVIPAAGSRSKASYTAKNSYDGSTQTGLFNIDAYDYATSVTRHGRLMILP